VKSEIDALFGQRQWKKSAKKPVKAVAKTQAVKAASSVRLLEKFEQAYLLIGFAAPSVSAKDYGPLKILNACLGGGMSGRLFQQLREQEGLAYDVGAFYPSKKCGSAFVTYLGLQPSRLEEAKTRIHKALNEMRRKPITAKELAETKNYIKGTYILDHQTNSQRAHYLGWWEILGLGHEFDRAYVKKLDSVTADDVRRVAKKMFSTHPITVEILPK
jgi:predicted Zn-dependent peptidase